MTRRKVILLAVAVMVLFITAVAIVVVTKDSPRQCIRSFDAFAYDPGSGTRDDEITPPLAPWRIEATIPPHQIEGYYEGYFGFNVAVTRMIEGHQEIWIGGMIFAETYVGRKSIFIVYRPESQQWEVVSTDIGDTGLSVANLFVDSNGAVWGRITWERGHEYHDMEDFPVLSRFDETSRRFEIGEGILEAPLIQERIEDGMRTSLYDETMILMDARDNFWIFVEDDGLYRYDSDTQTTERRTDFPDVEVRRAIAAPDGSIYFTVITEGLSFEEMYVRMTEGTLFQFIPETGEVIPIEFPDQELPIYAGMLVDYTGRLWLGSIAYREPDGTWHIMPPHAEELLNHLDLIGSGLWGTPYLMLASSDGILWYLRFLDMGVLTDGTAWYDPETGEGCLFTNLAANIIEDSEHNLWMVANGALYRYALD